ncbi:MAG: hypothetical protein E3K37_02395 [Candidatus Kuenenia sp.]|nr:hypothetical protein [Candidatus Kuenenia hertensis]
MYKVLLVLIMFVLTAQCFSLQDSHGALFSVSQKKLDKIERKMHTEAAVGNWEEVRKHAEYLVQKTKKTGIHHRGSLFLAIAYKNLGQTNNAIRAAEALNIYCNAEDKACPARIDHIQSLTLLYEITAKKNYLFESQRLSGEINKQVRLDEIKAQIINEQLQSNNPYTLASLYKDYLELANDPSQEDMIFAYLALRTIFDPMANKVFKQLSLENQQLLLDKGLGLMLVNN